MIWLWFIVHMCKMIISPSAFFILAKFWFFRVIREGLEGQKMAQNDKKKSCLSHSISEQLCIIWSWFLVNMCKMMISPAIFCIFSEFWFFFFCFWRGFKWKKRMTHKCQFQSVTFHILGTVNQFVAHKYKIISLSVFLNFLKLLIF